MLATTHSFPFSHAARLRYRSPTMGMLHLAEGARAWRWRVSAAYGGRRAAGTRDACPYPVVAGRSPYRVGGCVSSRTVRIRFSGNNAIVMPLILSKYIRRCYIIYVKLCSSENPTAQFSDSIANWPLKGGIRIAA